jgi:signal transduction histidine kinase/ActR/RegA family two-component response regulator
MLTTMEAPRTLEDARGLLALLRAITDAVQTAPSADRLLQVAVEALCAWAGCPIGQLYVPVDGVPGTARALIDHGGTGNGSGSASHGAFLAALAGAAPGTTPAARALAGGRPVWIADLRAERGSPALAAAARTAGLGTAFAVPVVAGGTVLAVLECVAARVIPASPLGEATLDQVGALLGWALGAWRTEALARDEVRRLEERAAELERGLPDRVREERLAALGQMASGIAHDFNNVLVPIAGFSELLVTQPQTLDDRAKAARYLGLIRTAANEAVKLVQRLREFYRSRDDTDWYQPVDLNPVVEQAVAAAAARGRDQARVRGVDVRIETELGAVPAVTGDANQLQTAVANLIANALDAMPNGGRLTVRTELVPGGPHAPQATDSPGRVRLTVQDTGTGMPEEVRQRCLEPFYSTKGERGTGLGLAVTLGIVRRHEGSLEVESVHGEGTRVVLHFPLGLRMDAGGLLTADGPARVFHLLLVDDEMFVREVMSELFLHQGHTVETAVNGRDGLEKFRAGRFDAVVTDRAMPELNGDQLAAAVKEAVPGTPVIMLTGHGERMRAAGERPTGVDLILSKPATTAKVREALARIEDCLALAAAVQPTSKPGRAAALVGGPRGGTGQ